MLHQFGAQSLDLVGERQTLAHDVVGEVVPEQQLAEQLDRGVRRPEVDEIQQRVPLEPVPAGIGVDRAQPRRRELAHHVDEVHDRLVEIVDAAAAHRVLELDPQLGGLLPGMVEIDRRAHDDFVVVVEISRADDPVAVLHLGSEQHFADVSSRVGLGRGVVVICRRQHARILVREQRVLGELQRRGRVVRGEPGIDRGLLRRQGVGRRGNRLVQPGGVRVAARAPGRCRLGGALVVMRRAEHRRAVGQHVQPDAALDAPVVRALALEHGALGSALVKRLVPVEQRGQALGRPGDSDVDAHGPREQRRDHGKRIGEQRVDVGQRHLDACHGIHGHLGRVVDDLALLHDSVPGQRVAHGLVEIDDAAGERVAFSRAHEQIVVAAPAADGKQRKSRSRFAGLGQARLQCVHHGLLGFLGGQPLDLLHGLGQGVLLQHERLAGHAEGLRHDRPRGRVDLRLALIRGQRRVRVGRIALERLLHGVPHRGQIFASVPGEHLAHVRPLHQRREVARDRHLGQRHGDIGDAGERPFRALLVQLARAVDRVQGVGVSARALASARHFDLVADALDGGGFQFSRRLQHPSQILGVLRGVRAGQSAMRLGGGQGRHHGDRERHRLHDELLPVGNGLPDRALDPVLVFVSLDAEEPPGEPAETLFEHLFDVPVVPHVLQPLEHRLRIAVGRELARDLAKARVGGGLGPHELLGLRERLREIIAEALHPELGREQHVPEHLARGL